MYSLEVDVGVSLPRDGDARLLTAVGVRDGGALVEQVHVVHLLPGALVLGPRPAARLPGHHHEATEVGVGLQGLDGHCRTERERIVLLRRQAFHV